jgi:hypothetical protein
MDAAAEDAGRARPRIAIARLAVGLAQGLAVFLLSEADVQKAWPSTAPALFSALVLVASFAPLIVIGGLGRIRPLTLAVWTAAAAAVLAVFAWHDIDAGIWSGVADAATRDTPALPVFVFSAIFVFVGHHLVGPADETRKLIAPYPVYFDWAWKDAVQLALSAAFVGVLWLALALGAELFKLIGIGQVEDLMGKRWFYMPVTAVAFAGAVQLTDVRIGLIRGVRTVGLVLLSWLLPVMTVLVLAFLVALVFTGLAPLFGARAGAGTMLSAGAVLIVLISAAYQDGRATISVVIRWAARIASLALIPLVLIAAYALVLRVRQYGFSPARIEAICCAVVIAGFAAGYGFAAVRRKGLWMAPLELTNVVMARVVMLLILLIFTPIADPGRLGVDDQMARLMGGKTTPAAFDYAFLRNQSGRYGTDALKRLLALKGSARNTAIAQAAVDPNPPAVPAAAKPILSSATVYPIGAVIPPTFIEQARKGQVDGNSGCLSTPDCEAYVLDIDGSGATQVLLDSPVHHYVSYPSGSSLALEVFKQDPAGVWSKRGDLLVVCADSIAALRAGRVTFTSNARRDVELAGRSFAFLPLDTYGCQETGGRSPPYAN